MNGKICKKGTRKVAAVFHGLPALDKERGNNRMRENNNGDEPGSNWKGNEGIVRRFLETGINAEINSFSFPSFSFSQFLW